MWRISQNHTLFPGNLLYVPSVVLLQRKLFVNVIADFGACLLYTPGCASTEEGQVTLAGQTQTASAIWQFGNY
ncbi:hypothetical protein ACN47E_000397 [Coniothyrium glycines]